MTRDTKAPGDLRDRLITLAGNRDHIATELLGIGSGHAVDPFSEAEASQQGVNRTLGSPRRLFTK